MLNVCHKSVMIKTFFGVFFWLEILKYRLTIGVSANVNKSTSTPHPRHPKQESSRVQRV